VIVLDIDADKLDRAGRYGAHHVIYGHGTRVCEQVMDVTEGIGSDLVFEASGAPNAPDLARTLVRRGGGIVLVGLQHTPSKLYLADLTLREITLVTTVAHLCDTDLPQAIALLADSALAQTAIERVIPLDDLVAEGLAPLTDGTVTGKVVVDPWA
jgi:(R,R)-butanediol dehydrogenase/meso-butanediol dehydrogenase/diacetyl reductase